MEKTLTRIVLLVIFCSVNIVICQTVTKKEFKIHIGGQYVFKLLGLTDLDDVNDFKVDKIKRPIVDDGVGFRMDLEIPSNYENVYYFTGGIIQYGWNSGRSFLNDSGFDEQSGYFQTWITQKVILNGGGIFGGICVTMKNNYSNIRLYSKIGLGYFAYEYKVIKTIKRDWLTETDLVIVSENIESLRSSSLGGMFDIGITIFEDVNIYFQTIISGSKQLTMRPLGIGISYVIK